MTKLPDINLVAQKFKESLLQYKGEDLNDEEKHVLKDIANGFKVEYGNKDAVEKGFQEQEKLKLSLEKAKEKDRLSQEKESSKVKKGGRRKKSVTRNRRRKNKSKKSGLRKRKYISK